MVLKAGQGRGGGDGRGGMTIGQGAGCRAVCVAEIEWVVVVALGCLLLLLWCGRG